MIPAGSLGELELAVVLSLFRFDIVKAPPFPSLASLPFVMFEWPMTKKMRMMGDKDLFLFSVCHAGYLKVIMNERFWIRLAMIYHTLLNSWLTCLGMITVQMQKAV